MAARGAAQQADGGTVEPVLIALAAAVLGALVAFALARRAPAPVTPPSIAPDLAVLREAVADLRTSSALAIGELRADVRRSHGETEQQVLTQSGSTQRALSDLGRQLAVLGEQSARVGDLAKDIGSLHDLLRAPKLRGGFGELLMQRVLEDALPAGSFQLQYTYRTGARVDAVVHFAGRLVPIDAKFPMEAFNALAAATDEADRKAKRRAFLQTVKRHVDSVARYISPDDGTIDYALMYVPAEQVFYEAVIREDDADLREYCSQKHVIPTSPNTLLAYLQLVSFGMKGLAMQERTRELHASIRHAALELEKFSGMHDQLGRHLENAMKKYTESVRGLDRAADAMESLTRAPAVEQPTLPLAPVERLFDEPVAEPRER